MAANDRSCLGVIQDPEVKMGISDDAASHLSRFSFLEGKTVLSIGDIKQLYAHVHEGKSHKSTKSGETIYLHEILANSDVLLPQLEIPERNPELEKRCSALKNLLAEKEYKRMTRNVDPRTSRSNPEDSIGFQMKQMNTALISVFQFVITIACAFFFGFVGIEVFVGGLQLPVRLLLGIMAALIVAGAELYFLAMNMAASEEENGTGVENFIASRSISTKKKIAAVPFPVHAKSE